MEHTTPPRSPMGDCCAHPSSTLLSGGTTPRHVRASGGTSPLGIPAFEGTPSQSCVRELAHLIGNTRQVRESTNSLDERAAVFDANDLASLLAMGSERNRLRMERQRLLTRSPVSYERRSPADTEALKIQSENELVEALCIATQERELLVREKGVLETMLKSTMNEVSRLLEAETLSEKRERLAEEQRCQQERLLQDERRRAREEVLVLQDQLALSETKRQQEKAYFEEKLRSLQSEMESARVLALSARERDDLEVQEAKSRLVQAEGKVVQAEATVRQLEERLTEMLHQAGEHAKERAVWQDHRQLLETRTKELSTLRHQLEASQNAEGRVTVLQKELSDAKQELQKSKLQSEQQKISLEADATEKATLRSQVSLLSAQVSEQQQRNSELNGKVESLKFEVAATTHKLEQQSLHLRKAEADVAAQAKAGSVARMQREIMKRDIATLREELGSAIRESDETRKAMIEQNQVLRKETERAAELEKLLRHAKEDAEKDKAALRKDIEELQELQQRGTGDATSMKEKIHELCSVNESLAMDKAVLEDDRNRLALRMQLFSQELEYHRSVERANDVRSADWLREHSALLDRIRRQSPSK